MAAGRVQAGSSLSSCLLHKGTILGALRCPRQGTSSPTARLPPPRRKETSLGMVMEQELPQELSKELRRPWPPSRSSSRGKPAPPGQEAACWGRRGLPTPTLGITAPVMPTAGAGAQGHWGQAARYGGTSRRPGVSCGQLNISPWRGQSGLSAASNSSGDTGSVCPAGWATSLQGSSWGWAISAAVTGCWGSPWLCPIPRPTPHLFMASRSYKHLFTASGSSKQPCAGRQAEHPRALPAPTGRIYFRLVFILATNNGRHSQHPISPWPPSPPAFTWHGRKCGWGQAEDTVELWPWGCQHLGSRGMGDPVHVPLQQPRSVTVL